MKTPLRNNFTKKNQRIAQPFFHIKKPRGSFATSQRLSSAPHLTTTGGHLAEHVVRKNNFSKINENKEELTIHLYDIAAWDQDKKVIWVKYHLRQTSKIGLHVFLGSVPHMTRCGRRAPTSKKTHSRVAKTPNSHQHEANMKTLIAARCQRIDPKKKVSTHVSREQSGKVPCKEVTRQTCPTDGSIKTLQLQALVEAELKPICPT